MTAPTRRVHLWLKHSITSISAEAHTSFHEEEEPEQIFHNDTIEFPTCRNIDDALAAFGFEAPHFCPPLPPLDGSDLIVDQHDWILDGQRDDEYHARRSQELLEELQAPAIEDVVTLKDPILGRQELQFAAFPIPSDETVENNDDFGDDFGEFQDAVVTDSAPSESADSAHCREPNNNDNVETTSDAQELKDGCPDVDIAVVHDVLEDVDDEDYADFGQAANGETSKKSNDLPLKVTRDTSSSSNRIPTDLNIAEEKKETEETISRSVSTISRGKEEAADSVSSPTGAQPREEEEFYEHPSAAMALEQEITTEDESLGVPYDIVETPMNDCDDPALDILSCSAASVVTSDSDEELRQMDVLTSEGRFLRRLKHRRAPDETVSLPQHFYEEDSTLCEDVLLSFPWKHVPILRQTKYRRESITASSNEQDMERVEDHLMEELMKLDEWLGAVTTQSLREVSARRSSLDLCNQHLRELHHSLAMADMYATRSKESIHEARGNKDDFTGLASGLILLESWDQRDDFRKLDQVLSSCAILMEQEQELQSKIEAFGQNTNKFEVIMEAARVFTASAHNDEQLSKLMALGELRERADHVMDTFAKQVETLVVYHLSASCVDWKDFSSTEYGNLLEAMNRIRIRQDESQVLAEKWTKCIIDTLLFEAEKSFARALLDPTYGLDSAHDAEILQLTYALKEDHGDFAKLKTISHNLVTIRFDFEVNYNYLPKVYHRLCLFLTDVLYCHCMLVQWHEVHQRLDKDIVKRMNRLLSKSKAKLWKRCEQVLVSCLEEYLNFATRKKLFEDKNDDTPWMNDLDSMHDILQITQQFSRVGKEFMGKDSRKVTCLFSDSSDSALRLKMLSVFKKHLRMLHVETMNSTGLMLSKESWQLVPMDPVEEGLTGFCSSETEFKTYLMNLIGEKLPKRSFTRRLWHNRVHSSQGGFFSNFPDKGNPFELSTIENSGDSAVLEFKDIDWTNPNRVDELHGGSTDGLGVYDMIASMTENNLTADSRIAVGSCFKGFTKCIARLLLVMKQLPVIIPDTTKVLQNVSDLFITTVFRLCTANSINEKLVLGMEYQTPYQMEFPKSKRKNTTPRIGFGRRNSAKQSTTRPPQPITSRLEGEICSPLPCEEEHVCILRAYIQKAQESLQGMVKLDMVQGWISSPPAILPDEPEEEYLCKVCTAFEKRQAAAWSCLFVAAVLDLIKSFASVKFTKCSLAELLNESDEQQQTDNSTLTGVIALCGYADTLLQVTPMIVRYSTRVACSQGIGSRRIVQEICRAEWQTTQLCESSNCYVELVCGRYAFIWRFLSTSAKLPTGVRSHAWEHLVAIGFMTFLEGFARVPTCSTEGRALMSMDLGAFASGTSPSAIHEKMDLDVIPRPPRVVNLPRGRNYVDTYVKVAYYPLEDMMNWIATNHTTYHCNHCLALTDGSPGSIDAVKAMYDAITSGSEQLGESTEHLAVEC